MWHDSFISMMWRIYQCDMTRSYVWHDSFIHVTWLVHTCDMTHSYVRHDSFIFVTWLIHLCDMTHSYVWHVLVLVWHDSFVREKWLIRMCDMTHSCVTWLIDMFVCVAHIVCDVQKRPMILQKRPTSCAMCATWLNYKCDTHPRVPHDPLISVTWRTYKRHMSLLQVRCDSIVMNMLWGGFD